ncbi:MAG: hypothetical protein M3Z64_02145 [Verrucomicrobiota bacterium]|nr:hypothetical protein [Verrucomicrobiota bacterium]
MFPLFTKTFPASTAELTAALNKSLERIFILLAAPVSARGDGYPSLEQIAISLDGAQLRPDPPRPAVARGETAPALQVAEFKMSGRGLSFAGATADLNFGAENLRLNSGRSAAGDIVLVLQSATNGQVRVATTKAALENIIAQVAKAEAGKHGVTIDGVRLNLQADGPRAVAAEVQLRAKKLFLSASIRITAHLALDENLNAKLSGLRCEGDGAIASVACGVLAPHLQKLDGREFALMALPLGEIRLRDMRLVVGDEIAVTAEFGAVA